MLQSGIEMQRAGRFEDAERVYQTVLHFSPSMPEAQNLMGTLALEADQPDIALEYFEKAVKGLTKNAEVRHNLGFALVKLHEFDLAAQHLLRAVDLKPGQVDSLVLLGQCYSRLERAAEALPFLDKAIRLAPHNEEAKVFKAEALINMGEMDKAEVILNGVIERDQEIAHAYRSLSSLKKYSAESPQLVHLTEIRKRDNLSQAQTEALAYAAAKMLHDAKLYDDSLAAYALAKTSQKNLFNIHQYRNHIDEMMAIFNPSLLLAKSKLGHSSGRPIFIVGMPRSGTTLTEQIVSSHPKVSGAGELSKMGQIARGIGYSPRHMAEYAKSLHSLTETTVGEATQSYLRVLDRHSRSAQQVTDKMPHNFEHIGLIFMLFPNAKVIHCKRDPIDNCMSCYMNAFNDTHSYNANFETLGLYYREYYRLMTYWHKIFPGRIFDSQYEELVDAQEAQTRRIIDYLGLEWDDDCLNYTENQKAVNTISRWQVRQPIYRTSIKRWKSYEKHIGALISALGDLAVVD